MPSTSTPTLPITTPSPVTPTQNSDSVRKYAGTTYDVSDPTQKAAYDKATTTPVNYDQATADRNNAALYPGGTPSNTNLPTNTTDQNQNTLNTNLNNQNSVQNQINAEGAKFSQSSQDMLNGAIPLNQGQQAQIQGITQQFQQFIDQQKLMNTSASGVANVRGYQTGSAEYDPTFQAKTIGTIFSAGQQKVANLQVQMASAIAAMTSGFENDNYQVIKQAHNDYLSALDKQQEQIQKTVEDTQAAIQKAKDAQQKIQDNINSIAEEAAKNGADQKTISAISAAGSVTDAINAAGGALQTGSGQIGDYLQYKRDTTSKGLIPLDYGAWKQQDDANQNKLAASKAYSTAYASASGKAAGENAAGLVAGGNDTVSNLAQQLVTGNLAPSELSKRATGTASYNAVLKAADDYSMLTTGKHFSIAQADRDYKFANQPNTQNTLNYLKSLTGTVDENGDLAGGNLDELKTLSDSIDRTSFPALNDAKAWGKLATGDVKYAQYQAVATEVADQVAKILQGGNGGTSDAKLQQATNLFNTGFSKDQLNGVIESLKPLLVNRATSMVSDNPYLSDYADDLGVGSNLTPSKQVDTYVKANPAQADTIAKLYEVPGATDQDVLDYINKIK